MDVLDKLVVDPEALVPPNKVLENVRILFADKDESVLALFREAITYLGWVGDYTDSVTGIIKLVNENCLNGDSQCYDAIVSGVNFFSEDGPRLTGITAARQIRKVRPDVPIIFVTSYVTSMVKEEARRLNAELLPKPIDVIDVLRKVSQLVYWNRLATGNKYEGDDRRKQSLHFGTENRRATDQTISIPEALSHTIESVIRSNYVKH